MRRYKPDLGTGRLTGSFRPQVTMQSAHEGAGATCTEGYLLAPMIETGVRLKMRKRRWERFNAA